MVVRSSLHQTRYTKGRKRQAKPRAANDLPADVRREATLRYDIEQYPLHEAAALLLRRCTALGHFSTVQDDDGEMSLLIPPAPEEESDPSSLEVAKLEVSGSSGSSDSSGSSGGGDGGSGGQSADDNGREVEREAQTSPQRPQRQHIGVVEEGGDDHTSPQTDEEKAEPQLPGGGGGGHDQLSAGADDACSAPPLPPPSNLRLEEFRLDSEAWNDPEKQRLLTQSVLDDAAFLQSYERFVFEIVIPYFKARLVAADAPTFDREMRFWYQYPPTMRLQPGPSNRYIRPHKDADYGHQIGELNFWMPLSPYALTQTTLWAESQPGEGDFHALEVEHGEAAVFFGTLCRHHVPANPTRFTRVSLDFRVGAEGCFDPEWVLSGTTADHIRRETVY